MPDDDDVRTRIHAEENAVNIRIQRIQNGYLLKTGKMPRFCADVAELKTQVEISINDFTAWVTTTERPTKGDS